MIGFTVLHLSPQPAANGYELSQINDISYFLNAGSGLFDHIATLGVDRNARIRADGPTNPVAAMFD